MSLAWILLLLISLAGMVTFVYGIYTLYQVSLVSDAFCDKENLIISSDGRTFCNSKEFVCGVETLKCIYLQGE